MKKSYFFPERYNIEGHQLHLKFTELLNNERHFSFPWTKTFYSYVNKAKILSILSTRSNSAFLYKMRYFAPGRAILLNCCALWMKLSDCTCINNKKHFVLPKKKKKSLNLPWHSLLFFLPHKANGRTHTLMHPRGTSHWACSRSMKEACGPTARGPRKRNEELHPKYF